jgi:hypothetical protein
MRRSNAPTPLPKSYTIQFPFTPLIRSWQLESEASHAALILVDRRGAVLLRIVRVTEEHALIPGGFLVFAYTARLVSLSARSSRYR